MHSTKESVEKLDVLLEDAKEEKKGAIQNKRKDQKIYCNSIR